MFLIRSGLVFGAAQMLHALCWNLQPFRFVVLRTDDKRKLEAAVRQVSDLHRAEHSRIEPGRAW
jgi:nitroreductase